MFVCFTALIRPFWNDRRNKEQVFKEEINKRKFRLKKLIIIKVNLDAEIA